MKLNTIQHPKLMRLKRRLNLQTWGAVGVLESLWHFASMHAKDGAIGRSYSNEDIANSLDWMGDPDELIRGLVSSGWLDECVVNRLVVHDWADHCPDFVRANLGRLKQPFAVAVQDEPTPIPNANTHTQQVMPIPNGNTYTEHLSPIPSQAKPSLVKSIPPNTPPTPMPSPPATASPVKPKVAAYDPKTAPLPGDLNTPRFRDAWTKWWTYRRERRLAAYKPTTIEQRLREFLEMGEANAAEAILHSIANGYQGVFPPKPTAASKQAQAPERWSQVYARNQANQAAQVPITVAAIGTPQPSQILPGLPALPSPGGAA